jgi:hypothetical protein
VSEGATLVILLQTIHEVMRAEKLLKDRSIWRDLIPTPRLLSSDCGMSLALREDDLPAALAALAVAGLSHRVYRKADAGYEQLH